MCHKCASLTQSSVSECDLSTSKVPLNLFFQRWGPKSDYEALDEQINEQNKWSLAGDKEATCEGK